MEQNKDIEKIEEINNEYTEDLFNILDEIKYNLINNSMSAIRIKRINDYAKTSYSETQEEFEERFPNTYKMNEFKNHVNIARKMLTDLLANNIDHSYYMDLPNEKTIFAMWQAESFLNLAKGKINLEKCKKEMFLASHEIEPEKFNHLNFEAILSLCEMSEKGINVSSFSNFGSLKIIFLNDFSKGKFKNKSDEAIRREQIIDCIEKSLNDFSMEEIKYNEKFSLYFDSDMSSVTVFSSIDSDPIAIINEDCEFEKGSLNIILVTIYKNVGNKEEIDSNDYNSIDGIIKGYNEMAIAEANQRQLASALAAVDSNKSDSNAN